MTRRVSVGHWLPFAIGSSVIAAGTARLGVVPTGDAPHMLSIADRLAGMLQRGDAVEFFQYWSSLVTPHPPAGLAVAVGWMLVGVERFAAPLTALTGLALAWHGVLLLTRVRGASARSPWMAALLVFSLPATWTYVAHMSWDVLAAGCVAACLGHLHASDGLRQRGHTVAFGAFMGLGFVTKYTFPAFLVLPVAAAGVAVVRGRTWRGLVVSLVAFAAVSGPWLFTHGDAVWAYVVSSSGASKTISDSPAMAWGARASWSNALYYPTVLRDTVGWPGMVVLGAAVWRSWHRPAVRWVLGSVLGAWFVLTFAGENQSRYFFPAVPLLAVGFERGLRSADGVTLRRWAVACALVVTAPALAGGWLAYGADEAIPPSRDQSHASTPLFQWGAWPQASAAFRPMSNPVDAWRVEAAVSAMAIETGDGTHQVGLLLPRDARMPPGSTYAWLAGLRGMDWSVATVVAQGPGGNPMVFVGPLKPMGDAVSRRFSVAYAVHQRGDLPDLLLSLGAQSRWQQDLPQGMQGTVFRVPASGWTSSTGQMLQKDPLDG